MAIINSVQLIAQNSYIFISSTTQKYLVKYFSPMVSRHVLLVTYPAQGHINPALRFAKRLINIGIHVTFVTSIYAQRRMAKAANGGDGEGLKGLTFTAFSDGYDDGFKPNVDDANRYMSEIRCRGSKSLKDIILTSREQGRPVTGLIYTILLPWAAEVAREQRIPSALLWIQPATVLDFYYYYFNGFENEINANCNDPSWIIQLPGIPLLSKRDLPSFVLPSISERYNFLLASFREQIKTLNECEGKPKVLVNSFDALEPNALKAIERYDLIGIGPLIPSAFLDGNDPSDKSFGGDLFKKSDDDYVEWLNSKPVSSVVYVSFGSLLNLPKVQMEEIAKGLIGCHRPFLWVIRVNENVNKEAQTKEVDDDESCLDELEKVGKLVPWCSQLEVLTHPSLGCFVTHCGWNSTLESLSCGVPMVAFPQWSDQGTTAKLIEDEWRVGVRVTVNENGVVESDEVKMCIEKVMDGGEKCRELRENVKKWKGLAREAMEEDGSSNKNLKDFFQEIGDHGF